MTLNEIKQQSKPSLLNTRVAFRLDKNDLNTFKEFLKGCEIKLYFENCINNFNQITTFSDIKEFTYTYKKDKAYTISISNEVLNKVDFLSNEYNISVSDLFRYIVLKSINKG